MFDILKQISKNIWIANLFVTAYSFSSLEANLCTWYKDFWPFYVFYLICAPWKCVKLFQKSLNPTTLFTEMISYMRKCFFIIVL